MTHLLRSNSSLIESRYYQNIPDAFRPLMFSVGNLKPDKIPIPPLVFYENNGQSFYLLLYIGPAVAGYPGMAHGGILATILDEALAGCASAALPGRVTVTLQLSIQYRKPAPTNCFYIFRAKTDRIEGKSAWVEGHLAVLHDDIENGEVVVEGHGHYLQPASTHALYSPI
ncbi:HotDog domain-containing protein [Penicillium verhagenii]|nr:HotDog domain-containing protein [Penicillium verhagenii]